MHMSSYYVCRIILYCHIIRTITRCYHVYYLSTSQNLLSLQMNSDQMSYINSKSNTRRIKINKYSNFSKKESDPLLIAIENSNLETINSKIDYSLPSRGTTVPTILASNNIPTNLEQQKTKVPYQHINKIVPSDPFTFGYVEIGSILGAHGVKGEIKVQIESDFSEIYFKSNSIIYIRKPNRKSPRPIQILNARKQTTDRCYLMQLKHITTRLGALAFRKYIVYVREQDRPILQHNEYLIRDVVGMNCYLYKDYHKFTQQQQKTSGTLSAKSIDIDGNCSSLPPPIAVIVGVIPPDELCEPSIAHLMHAQLELMILSSTATTTQRVNDSTSKGDELCLVPLVPSIVPIIDVVNRRIFLSPPSGLLDVTYKDQPKRIIIRGYLPQYIDRLSIEDREYLNAKYRVLNIL